MMYISPFRIVRDVLHSYCDIAFDRSSNFFFSD